MNKTKSILLPEEFFTQTYLLLWRLEEFYDLDGDTSLLCDSLEVLINKKLEAMKRRSTFSDYKRAIPGSPERETLRIEYLDLSFCPKSWCSCRETLDDCNDDDLPF